MHLMGSVHLGFPWVWSGVKWLSRGLVPGQQRWHGCMDSGMGAAVTWEQLKSTTCREVSSPEYRNRTVLKSI